MVVDGNGELLFRTFLPDHILVQVLLQLQWLRELVGGAIGLIVAIVFQDGIAHRDALITDVGTRIVARGRDQLADNVLAFMTEGTTERVVRTSTLHTGSPLN